MRADDTPSSMDLARQYRDQLVGQSGTNGTTLVATYYDHNDTITKILNDPTQWFTQKWPGSVPGSTKKTADYMAQSDAAGRNPDNSAYVVGDDDYVTHAGYMSTALKATCNTLRNGSTDPENPYFALATATVAFAKHTHPYSAPSTFNTVMGHVQTGSPMTPEQMAAVEEPAAFRRGRELAERDHAEWLAKGGPEAADEAGTAAPTTFKDQGTFSVTFALPTLTFSGTVTATPSVTLTALSADAPSIDIRLSGGSDPDFENEVQSKIDDAEWFQTTIGTKINAQLGSPAMLQYLSQVINQALASRGPGHSSGRTRPAPRSNRRRRRST
jgi:hypothetical protein